MFYGVTMLRAKPINKHIFTINLQQINWEHAQLDPPDYVFITLNVARSVYIMKSHQQTSLDNFHQSSKEIKQKIRKLHKKIIFYQSFKQVYLSAHFTSQTIIGKHKVCTRFRLQHGCSALEQILFSTYWKIFQLHKVLSVISIFWQIYIHNDIHKI